MGGVTFGPTRLRVPPQRPSTTSTSTRTHRASYLRPTRGQWPSRTSAPRWEVRVPVCIGGQPRKEPVPQGHLQPAPKSKPRRSRTRSSCNSSKCSSSSSNSRQPCNRQHCSCSSSSSGCRWPSNSSNNNNNWHRHRYALCLPLRALSTLLRAPYLLSHCHVGGQLRAASVPGIPQRAVDDQRARGHCRAVQACGRLA